MSENGDIGVEATAATVEKTQRHLYERVREAIFDKSPRENWQRNIHSLDSWQISTPEGCIELFGVYKEHVASAYPFNVIELVYTALKDDGVDNPNALVTEETIAAADALIGVAKWLHPSQELTLAAIKSGDVELAVRLAVEHSPKTGEELLELVKRYRDVTKPLHDGVL